MSRALLNFARGREAEGMVADHLISMGWKLLLRNYRKRGFEVDLVTSRGGVLVLVEVKYRLSVLPGEGCPQVLMPRAKRRALLRASKDLATLFDAETIRFDLALVYEKGPAGVKLANKFSLLYIPEAFEAYEEAY